MANNPYVNKVEYGGATIMDITDTTAVASDVAVGKYFYTAAGVKTLGTNAGGTDTSDATATAANILAGKTAYVASGKVTGTAAASVSGSTLYIPEGLVTV